MRLRPTLSRLVRTLRGGDERVTVRAAGIRCRFFVAGDVERFRTVGFGGEEELLREFAAMLTPSDVVIDVGASVGLFTVVAARLARSVIAFEPDPETNRRLRQNLRLNRCANVDVLACALGAETGRRSLYSDGVSGFAPSFARQDRVGAPRDTVSVDTQRLDELIESGRVPPPSVIKIDTEGAEGDVLAGAKGCLSGAFGPPPRSLWLELHPDFLEVLGSSTADVESILTECGFVSTWSRNREGQIHRHYRPRPDGGTAASD